MIRVLKSFLKCLAFAYVSVAAGCACGWPVVGLFVALVPVMVGFLWIWDYVQEAAMDCWMCGRTRHMGRYLLMQDWFAQGAGGDVACHRCGRKLVQAGDKVFGKRISAKAA
ncbi:MAG: hypothetical protein RL272_1270 [Candidatus Parcubacteria bacterium]|jgi:hypothetical protein